MTSTTRTRHIALPVLLVSTLLCGYPMNLADAFSSVSKNSATIITTRTTRRARASPGRSTTSLFQHSTSAKQEESSSSPPAGPFADFDYESQWYPVIWARDLQLRQPTKVTVFDVDYVVAKLSDNEVIGMKDACPHKAAALSQGRVTAAGNFQCAYHGWSFNGTTGDCVEIPQLVRGGEEEGDSRTATLPSRSSGTAVPVQIHEEMVWLFPGGGLEKALLAPPPPCVEEYGGGFKMAHSLRDMPVDWPIVVSNICDADHGLFAHQAKAFDMYSASIDVPFESVVSEITNGGKGWTLKTKVDSRDKLLDVDRKLRSKLEPAGAGKKTNTKRAKKEKPTTTWATFCLQAPTHIQLKRIDKVTGKVNFVTLFHVCPVGVGRTRFMGASLAPVKTPRWVTTIILGNFLDQDTYMLATQQQNILSLEAAELRSIMKDQSSSSSMDNTNKNIRMSTRKRLFCLASPSDGGLVSRLEQFWDETLAQSPNRVQNLLKLDEAGAFLETPSREIVLDRKTQHLDICKESQDVVRNCRRIRRGGRLLSLALVLCKFLSVYPPPQASLLQRGGLMLLQRVGPMQCFLKPSTLVNVLSFLLLGSFLADRMEKEYYFKYTDDLRRKDMNKIPKQVWVDK